MDSSKDRKYDCPCKECKYGLLQAIRNYDMFKQCSHPAVKASKFSTDDFRKFTNDDFIKGDRLIEEILKLKINPLSIACLGIFGFPFMYEPIWIEGCEGFVKNT